MNGKFYKLPQDLAARTDLTPSAKLVYAVIADRIGANGKCWPGERSISRDAGMGLMTVSMIFLESSCVTTGAGEYAPIPPVLGPRSWSKIRL